jgi:hypothetical protein
VNLDWKSLKSDSYDRRRKNVCYSRQYAGSRHRCGVGALFTIDAKSLLGIFSLDLTKPVEVVVHGTAADREKFAAQNKICNG